MTDCLNKKGVISYPFEEVKGCRAGRRQGRIGPQMQHGHVVHGERVAHFGREAEVSQCLQLVLAHASPMQVHQAQMECSLCVMLQHIFSAQGGA